MTLHARPYTLQLKHPFTLATGSRRSTPCVLVEINALGVTGVGEASMPPYCGETIDSALAFLERAAHHLPPDPETALREGLSALAPILAEIDRIAPGNHAAKAAVDIALHDWLGRLLGAPCHALLGIPRGPVLPTSFTIGIAGREETAERVAEAAEFPILKVKLGGRDDCAIIEAVRSVTERPVRVDANQGWGEREEAARLVEWLAGQGVELVEQPFSPERFADTAWLRERSPIPLVGDESVRRLSDMAAAADAFDGVNIKLMKCTGMHEAHRMFREAQRLGLRTMLGCMTETSCGIGAALQLAPLAEWIDLDGSLLISNDPFTGVTFVNGRPMMPEGPGIGVSPLSQERRQQPDL